jgi:hypothetical protein
MACTEFLKARVAPEIKLQVKAVAEREFLSETAWLKRSVLREIRACDAAQGGESETSRAEINRRPSREARRPNGGGKPMLVRLRIEDRLLLDACGSAGNAPVDVCVCPPAIAYAPAHAPPEGRTPSADAQHRGARVNWPEHQPDRQGS